MTYIKTPVKGMNDVLPATAKLRRECLDKIRDVYASFGFCEIETPAMENIENLSSNDGGENESLIFKVLKRGESLKKGIHNLHSPNSRGMDEVVDCGLRYDLTVPLVRYYSNNATELGATFKSLQIGNVWRADKPQRGRFRQFTQCDIDILGDAGNHSEVELICATTTALSRVFESTDIKEFTVRVNDRAILQAAALSAGFAQGDIGLVLISLDKYDKIGMDGVRRELESNNFDSSAISKYMSLYEGAEGKSCDEFCAMINKEFLDESVVTNLAEIVSLASDLSSSDAKIIYDPTLVRGMGYYTGPVFEISIDGLGSSVAGGGRYDAMIKKFTGQDVCAVGFSIGFERIVTLLSEAGARNNVAEVGATAFLLAPELSAENKRGALAKASALRQEGSAVGVFTMKRNMKAQVTSLEALGYTTFEKFYQS